MRHQLPSSWSLPFTIYAYIYAPRQQFARVYNEFVQGYNGFVDLHNPMGLLLILFAGFLFVAIIVVGAKLVRAKESADRDFRAELRREVEAARTEGREPRV